MSGGAVIRSGWLTARLETAVDIAAPAKRIWAVLTDFARFPEWNPFIPEIEGRLRVGERLRIRLAPPEGRAMTFRPQVLVVRPERELRWRGQLLVSGLFDGEHVFELEERGHGRVRFRQQEHFGGLLVPLFARDGLERTRRGFEAMNAALKRRAEAGAAGP